MRQCRGCGSTLSKRSQKTYCGNACQASARRRSSTKRWLESGEASWGRHPPRPLHPGVHRRSAIGMLRGLRRSAVWLGLPLALVLDHIDGDPTNNRRENLRLVCPNCDSQSPTYKSRNRGNGRHYRRQRYANGQSF